MRRLDFELADATIGNGVLAQRRHEDPVALGRAAGDRGRRVRKPHVVVLDRWQGPEALTSGPCQNAFAASVGYQTIAVGHVQILSTVGAAAQRNIRP